MKLHQSISPLAITASILPLAGCARDGNTSAIAIGTLLVLLPFLAGILIILGSRKRRHPHRIEKLTDDILQTINQQLRDTLESERQRYEREIAYLKEELRRERDRHRSAILPDYPEIQLYDPEEAEDEYLEEDTQLQPQAQEGEVLKPDESPCKSRILQLYRERWYLLTLMCKELYERPEKTDQEKMGNMERELNKLKTREMLKNLEDEIDRDFDRLAARLRNQCHMLPEEDLDLCVLTFAGLPSSVISWITGTPVPSLYVRRQRIKKRITRSNAPDRKIFLEFFSS